MTDSSHIKARHTRQIDLGSQPRMPSLVMIVIKPVITRPSVQAKRFGLADTQSGGCRRVIQPASRPIGLREMPAVTRTRKSTKNTEATICRPQYRCSKYA